MENFATIVNLWKPLVIVAQLSVLDVCRSPDNVSDGDEVLPTAKNTLTSKVEAVANSKSDYMSYFIKEICLPYL